MAEKQHNKALMRTILLIALVQMIHAATMPGINIIATEVFPQYSLQTIQTAMSLPGVLSVFSGFAAAMLVRYGICSKRFMVLAGLLLIVLTGVTVIILNTRFWQLCIVNVLLGLGMGAFIPSAQSITFDNFDQETRQFITGVQFSFINGGGIILSLLAGFLIAELVWYGGYMVTLLVTPVLIVSFINIPKDEKMKSAVKGGIIKTKLPTAVYYYAFLSFLFMIFFNVLGVNLSTHLAAGNIGDSATAGIASAILMAGGVIFGFSFTKLSPVIRDYIFPLAFLVLFVAFTLLNLFSESLFVTFVSMFMSGSTLSLFVPRCVFNVSNLTDPTNSATATMLIASVAPGSGTFLSPIIMTNITYAIGGHSTRFRFQFSAFVCLVIAVILFAYHHSKEKAVVKT